MSPCRSRRGSITRRTYLPIIGQQIEKDSGKKKKEASLTIAITGKTAIFALKPKAIDMSEYTFEMVPGLVGRIAELLASIDQKLDRVNVTSTAADKMPELMDIKQLGEYLPTHPSPSTIYGWCHENQIPYYKHGKRTFFKKSEIDKWLLRTRVKDQTELMEEAAEYCRTHPIGGRRR